MLNRISVFGPIFLILLGCLALSGKVYSEASVSDRWTEEIVVTAEKKEAALQSTPIAITAIGAEEIILRGIQNMSDVQYVAPGVSYNQTGPTGFITMRGVGLEFTEMASEPGVALHSDGVYRGGSMSATNAMFDMERIEIVRGPQGTLNGRNSTGGSINFISRLPGDEASFEAGFTIGDYDRYRYELSGDIPVSENFAIRLAGVRDEREGYSFNSTLNTDEDGMDYSILKAAAVFTPNEDLEFILRIEHSSVKETGPLYLYTQPYPVAPLITSPANPGGILNVPNGFCGPSSCADVFGINFPAGVAANTNPRETAGESETYQNSDIEAYSLTTNYQINDNLTVRYIAAYYEQDLYASRDIDGTPLAFFTSYREEHMQESSHELTFLGENGNWDWVFGAHYYKSDNDAIFNFEIPALQTFFESFFGIAGGGPPLPAGTMAFFGTRADGTSPAVPFLDDLYFLESKSSAVYAQATYSFTDTFRGTLGVRNTNDEKEFGQTSLDNLFGEQCVNQLADEDWSETTGKIGIDADLSDRTMVYGSVSRGFRSGGFDGGACFDEFDPEVLTAFEVGMKTSLLDDSMRLNLSAFVYDYEDYQARLFTATGTSVLNASGADIQGAEIEINWLASERFRVDGSISLLNTEFKDFLAENPMRPENGLVELSGNSLLRAPEIQASITADYDIPLSSGLLTLRGEYAYMDEQHHSLFNDPLGLEPARSMVNARVFFQPSAEALENVTITGFVNNVADDEYKVMYVLSGLVGGVTTAFGAPRTWGITVRYMQ